MNTEKTTEKQRKLKNGNPSGSGFKPGQSGNPNGRAPKYITTVTDKTGYKNSEIADCMKSILKMNKAEISQIIQSESTPILENLVASAILGDIQKMELRNLDSILNRCYGKPKDSIDMEVDLKTGLTPELEMAAKILHERNLQTLTKEELEIEGVERFGLERWERMKNAMYDE